jgi:hypothetical protein
MRRILQFMKKGVLQAFLRSNNLLKRRILVWGSTWEEQGR